jgi:uncharacterized membrane protein YesL
LAKKDRKPRIRLLDINRDGKGVEKGEDKTPNLKYFFKLFGRKFTKIISATMIMNVMIFPLLIALYLYFFASPTTPTAYYAEFPALYGINQLAGDSINSVNMSSFMTQFGLPAYNTYIYYVIGALAIFHIATFGLQMVGSTYIMRGLVRGDSVFVMSDYFYAIKKNWKQGLVMGIIDTVIIGVLAFDFMHFYSSFATPLTNFMYAMTVALICLYIVFRYYIYLILITFNIKLTKAIKNSFIFTVLGLKRNFLAFAGMTLLTVLAVVLVMLFMPLGVGVVLVLPLIYHLGVCGFMATYAAYPIIQKYMIDPPAQKKPTAKASAEGPSEQVESSEA